MISVIMSHFIIPSPFDLIAAPERRIIDLKLGETVFRQGDETKGLYCVIEGSLELIRNHQNGHSVVIYKAGQGETFAEASLYSDFYHCDARATEPSKVVLLSKNSVLAAIRTDYAFAEKLMKRFGSQIQGYRRRLELLTINDATERTFAAITDQMLTGSIMQLSREIGLSHEAVYRSLAELVRQKRLLKTGRGRYDVI